MNIVFDFGNVLVRWEPQLMFTDIFGDNEPAYWYFWRHICSADWRNRIDAGESIASCIAELQGLYPEYAEAIGHYDSRWETALTGEMPGMRTPSTASLIGAWRPVPKPVNVTAFFS